VIRRPLDPPLAMPDTVIASRTDSPPELQPLVAAARRIARELRRCQDQGGLNLSRSDIGRTPWSAG
jgi:hypothetical protein